MFNDPITTAALFWPYAAHALTPAFAIAALAVFGWALLRRNRYQRRRRFRGTDFLTSDRPAIGPKPLMTPWERATYRALSQQVPPSLHTCPQVRLLDLLVLNDHDEQRRRDTVITLGAKSIDFVIIDFASNPILAIELNDRTHNRPDRRHRDAIVSSALTAAGIPLATFKPGDPIDISPWIHRR